MIVITVRERDDRPGVYDAHYDGRYLCSSSSPFIDGCRALLAQGHDPEARVVMRRARSLVDAVRGRLGIVAGVEINGHGTGFRRARAGAKAPAVPQNCVAFRTETRNLTRARDEVTKNGQKLNLDDDRWGRMCAEHALPHC